MAFADRVPSQDFTLAAHEAGGSSAPLGLWSDGTTMWVSDNGDDKIYAYNLATKARDSSKDFDTLSAAGNTAPRGIWSDGTTMWVADETDDKLYAYNLATKARDSSKDFDTLNAAGNTNPLGLWSDGTTVWVSDNGDRKIYAYNLATKARDSSKDFDTLIAAGHNNPIGIWSDGTTMWVSDNADDKIYAYNLATKARDSSKDFDTLSAAGNTFPFGLWSDGTTMWVADDSDDKLYAYELASNTASAISLADSSITSATPGVLVKGTVDPSLINNQVFLVNAGTASQEINDQIDTSYIVNGDTAYLTLLRLDANGGITLWLNDDTGFGGQFSDPQFTATALANLYVVLFYGSTSAAWDGSVLDDSDSIEPYTFSAASVTAAGPTINATLRSAINADSTVIAMLVDSTADGIDIANLTYEEPVVNTAPTVTMAAPTSPVDGSATQALTGTFSDDQGNDTATITIAASLGTLGAVTKDDAAGTWEAEYTAPASTTAEQTDTVTVTATDDGALTDTASRDIVINADLMPSLPTIFSQSATVGTAFSLTFSAATGGDPPLTYALSGNPAWLTLSGFTLSGTPDATGTHQVRITVEDFDGDTDFRAFIITVSAAADLTPSLPAIANQTATVGTAFSLIFNAATGGDTPLSYSVSGNPAWLTLSTRTLSGTPTGTGTHTVTVTVTDNDNDTDTSSFTLTVSAAAVLLTLADFDVPTGHEEVDAALITSGLDTNGWHYNIDLSLGTVEDGSIEPETGYEITRIRHNSANLFQLNDNPDAENLADFFASGNGSDLTIYIQDATGVSSFVVADQTVDSSGGNWTRWNVPDAFEAVMARIASGDLFILAFTRETAVTDLMPTAPTVTNKTGTVGTAFSTTLPVGTGGDTPLSYSVSGEPSWASFNATTRVLSGTPNAAATTTVTYTVEDDDGDTDSTTFNIVVSAATPDDLMPSLPAIFSQSATVGTFFTLTFSAATGGDPPLSYSVSGNPAWLTLSNLTLSGTPTAAGSYTVVVTVEDNDGDTASRTFILTVTAAADLMPTAGNTTNKSYSVDTDFSFTLVAGTGGDGTLAITVAGLPTGATFDGTDTITGNVSTAGTHTITVTYTDDDGDTDDDTFVLTITSASTADATTYRFENIDLSSDALEDVFTRFSGSLATAGAWTDRSTGVTPTSNTGPGTNSSGPYVFSESSASSGPAEILTNSKLVMLSSIMDTWTGTGRSITFRVCIQGTGWSGDDEGLRIITGTTEADSTQLYRLTGWDYSNNYTVGDTVTNRQDDDYTIVQVGGWIDYTIGIPDGHEYFELSSFIVALGSFHLHDLALWQITLTNGAGGTDTDAVPEPPTAPTLTATDTSITVTLSSDPTSDAAITSRDIRWRETGGTWATVEGITSPHTISTGIAESTEYEAQWRAVSSVGDGAWSPSDTITTLATDLMPSLPAIADQTATVGTAFSLTFNAATGGDTPLAYSVSGNPAWLTLSSLTLSGTPTATGTHTVTVTVTDNDNDTDTSSFTLTVSAAVVLLTLADFSVPTGNELVTSALIEAGAADFIYRDDDPTAVETSDSGEILDGDLEPATGYRMSLVRHPAANGFIFNDRPEADSISDFFGTGGDGADLTIHVQDDTGVASFVPVDATVFASSDDFVRWDVPDAFETVLARIGTGDRLIIAFTRETVTDLMPTAPTVANQTATVGTAFSVTLPVGTGGDTPLSYSVSGEPSWASFNTTSRLLSGTPNAAGTTTVTYTVTDDDGDTDSSTFNIVVSAADLMPTAPTIGNRTATVGTAYTQTLSIGTGGNAPLTYTATGLPAGLTFATSTRQITGTPTTANTYTVTYTVTDDDGDTDSTTFNIVVSAADLMPSLPSIANQSATVGTSFSLNFSAATGGDTPLSYSVSGNPAWLTLSNRTLSGTPTGTGTHTVTVTVTDDDDDTDTSSFVLTVDTAPNTAPTIAFTTAASIVDGESVTTISGTVTDSEDANGSITVTASTNRGTVSTPVNTNGTWTLNLTAPAVAATQRNMNVTVTAEDSGSLTDTASRTWTVRANVAPTVTITTADGEHNGGSTVDLDATVGAPETGQSVTVLWEITSGTGTLSNSTSATLASITLPSETTAEQSITIRITATDALNSTATDSVTLTIPAAAIVDLATPSVDDEEALLGIAYSRTLPEVEGETGTITRTATGLPTGLSFNATTRVLSGTPTSTGTYTVTYTITDDDDSDSTSTTFDITIANEISLLARSITASLSGIALAGNVNPTLTPSTGSGTTVNIVSAGAGSRRINSTIDSNYVDSSPAYLTNFYFNANNGVLHVGSTPSTSIQISGLDFNEDGFDDLGIAVGTSDGDEYGWRLGDLVGSDTSAPYALSSGNFGTAGNSNSNTLRSNIGNDDDTKVVLADRTDPNIDWSNLTYSPTPSLPAVDDIEVYVGGSVSETLPVGSGDQVPLSYSVATLPSWLSFNTTTRVLSGTVPANTYDADQEISLTYTIEDGGGTTDTSTITIRILLSLEHFSVLSGQELVTSALYERGSVSGVSAFFYRDDDRDSGGDATDVGVLVDGELEPETGYYISRVRYRADGLFQFNDNPDADNLESFFGATGNGNDLIVSIQDSQGVESFVVADTTVNSASGGNLVVWEVPDAFNDILSRISSASTGEQFIVAMTRVTIVTPPDTTPSLPSISNQTATVGTVFSLTFTAATSGNAPLAYSVSGNPAWLTLSNLTLSGTPNAIGTHTVAVMVEDGDGDTDTSSFTLTVTAPADLMPTAGDTTNKSYAVDTDFSFTLVAGMGGDTPLTITVSGLPTGATFDDTDTITGNVSTAGAHTITATYTDDDGDTDDDTFVLTITSASTTGPTTYRFENIDEDADALEDVFTRFSGSLATAGAWIAQGTGVTPTSITGPGTNSSGPYVYSESSSSSGPAEILTNSKLVMLESIMDTWTGAGRSITLRVCIQGTGWSGR